MESFPKDETPLERFMVHVPDLTVKAMVYAINSVDDFVLQVWKNGSSGSLSQKPHVAVCYVSEAPK